MIYYIECENVVTVAIIQRFRMHAKRDCEKIVLYINHKTIRTEKMWRKADFFHKVIRRFNSVRVPFVYDSLDCKMSTRDKATFSVLSKSHYDDFHVRRAIYVYLNNTVSKIVFEPYMYVLCQTPSNWDACCSMIQFSNAQLLLSTMVVVNVEEIYVGLDRIGLLWVNIEIDECAK